MADVNINNSTVSYVGRDQTNHTNIYQTIGAKQSTSFLIKAQRFAIPRIQIPKSCSYWNLFKTLRITVAIVSPNA